MGILFRQFIAVTLLICISILAHADELFIVPKHPILKDQYIEAELKSNSRMLRAFIVYKNPSLRLKMRSYGLTRRDLQLVELLYQVEETSVTEKPEDILELGDLLDFEKLWGMHIHSFMQLNPVVVVRALDLLESKQLNPFRLSDGQFATIFKDLNERMKFYLDDSPEVALALYNQRQEKGFLLDLEIKISRGLSTEIRVYQNSVENIEYLPYSLDDLRAQLILSH